MDETEKPADPRPGDPHPGDPRLAGPGPDGATGNGPADSQAGASGPGAMGGGALAADPAREDGASPHATDSLKVGGAPVDDPAPGATGGGSAGEPPPAAPVIPRGWKIALFSSLAVNLVVAGLVFGAWVSGPPSGPGGPGPRDLAFGPYTFALTRQDRHELLDALRDRQPGVPGPRELMLADRTGLARILRRDPFDRAAATALLDAQRGRADERFRLGQRLLLDHIAAMSPAERSAMADRLERGPGRD